MYTLHQVVLCERIREHCRQRQWYAGDFSPEYRVALYDLDGTVSFDEDFSTSQRAEKGFLYLPATEAEVRDTEQRLGFGLPPALHAVYTLVANGGFGPGCGLVSVPVIANTLTRGTWQLGERTHQHLARHPRECVMSEDEPAGLLTLAEWEEPGVYSKLDGATGIVYSVRHDIAPPEPEWERAITAAFEAVSVEDWLERWLAGDLRPFEDDLVNFITASDPQESEDMDQDFEPSSDDLDWYERHFAWNAASPGG